MEYTTSSIIKVCDPTVSYIMCMYIPPGLLMELFVSVRHHIVEILDHFLCVTPDAKLYVCGDLNRYDFSFLTRDFNLSNIVNIPTFRDTTLDKFFCDSSELFSVKSAPPLGCAVNLHNVIFISRHDKFL